MSSLRATQQLLPKAPRAANAGRRTLTTTSRQSLRTLTARPRVAALPQVGTVARQLTRNYADVAPKKAGKVRKTFRWAWRLTYLSALGLFGYIGYVVYDDRHPEDQVELDPTKKTLVILGEFLTRRPARHPYTHCTYRAY